MAKRPASSRADQLVVAQGLADSRSRAAALILAGGILTHHGTCVAKAGQLLCSETILRRRGAPLPYVSRGGLKLAAALDHFAVAASNRTCLDVGASTGGFTDCLLQRGANHVFALDVGHSQLHWRLRQDRRVTVLERLNIRAASRAHLPNLASLIVIDVSFISLRTVLPAALRFAAAGASVVALIKPQFEVGRAQLGKAGVVRNVAARDGALAACTAVARACGLDGLGVLPSPLTGAKGNQEFLMKGRLGSEATGATQALTHQAPSCAASCLHLQLEG